MGLRVAKNKSFWRREGGPEKFVRIVLFENEFCSKFRSSKFCSKTNCRSLFETYCSNTNEFDLLLGVCIPNSLEIN
jgi:hypothetical protein